MVRQRARIELLMECQNWAAIDPQKVADACVGECIRQNAINDLPVSILLTDNAAMAALNKSYRGKDAATNVLSFPAGDSIIGEHAYLGDIAIGFEICASEAAEKSIPVDHHAAHLIVHGLLHLAGYDHLDDASANEMEQLEIRILQNIGIQNPYKEEGE